MCTASVSRFPHVQRECEVQQKVGKPAREVSHSGGGLWDRSALPAADRQPG